MKNEICDEENKLTVEIGVWEKWEKSINLLDAINLNTNQEREKEKRLLMMKAMFKKFFKGSSKDRVAAVAGPQPANITCSNDPEANNKVGSPSKRIKWWEAQLLHKFKVLANFVFPLPCVANAPNGY